MRIRNDSLSAWSWMMTVLIGLGCWLPMACWGSSQRILTEADQGSTIHLQKGRRLAVRLQAQPGTGYQWQLLSIPAELEPIDPPKFIASENHMPGAKAIQEFTFKAIQTGQARLAFQYRRPWETSSAPARVFETTIYIE